MTTSISKKIIYNKAKYKTNKRRFSNYCRLKLGEYKMGKDIFRKQKQIVDKYCELFNDKIRNKIKGRQSTNFIGFVMENALRKLLQEELEGEFKGTKVRAEKGFIRYGKGDVFECDIIVYPEGMEDKTLSKEFNTIVVSPENVVAAIEVKSFADSNMYKRWKNQLKQANLTEKGYFVGITGSIKDIGNKNGVDLNCRPKMFIFSKSSPANIKKGVEMNRNKMKDYPRALESLLKDIKQQVKSHITPKLIKV